MDKKGLFNAPDPIFNSDQEPEQLYIDGIGPDAFEDIAQTTPVTWSNEQWTGTTFTAQISRSISLSHIAIVDDPGGTVQSDWAICLGSNNVILATPPTATRVDGDFKFRYVPTNTDSDALYINNILVWSNIVGGRTLRGRLTFYDARVTGITESDFEVVTSTGASTTGWDITSVSSSSADAGDHVNVIASPPEDAAGDFRLQIKSRSIRRSGRNYPSQPVFSTAIFVDDRSASAVVATASWSHVTGGQFLRGRVTFAGAIVTTVSSSDFEVLNSSGTVQSNWCVHVNTTFTTASRSYITVTANPPSGQNARFRIRLKANSVRSGGSDDDNAPAQAQSTALTDVDSRAPASPVVAGATWANVSGGTRLSGDVTFTGADVIHIAPEDFQVLDSSDSAQGSWTITVSSPSVTAGNFITVHAVPPDNTDDRFKLRLMATSVRSGGSSTNNAPSSNEDTALQDIDNTQTIATLSFGNVEHAYARFTPRGQFQELAARDSVRHPGMSVPLTVTGSNIIGLRFQDFDIIPGGSSSTTIAVGYYLSDNFQGAGTREGRSGFQRSFTGEDDLYDSLTNRNIDGVIDGNTITLSAYYIINTTQFPPHDLGIDGHFRFRFNANSVRSGGSTVNDTPENYIFSSSIYINTTNRWNVSGGRTLFGDISNINFTNIATQLDILNEQNQIVTGWRVSDESDSPISTANPSNTIVAHPPPNTGGLFRLRLNANSVIERDASTVPADNVLSDYVVVDNISVIAEAVWSNVHYCPTNGKLQATLTFSGVNVTDIEAGDFQIEGTEGRDLMWTVDAPPSSANAGAGILIAATPPPNTNGSYGFVLEVGSVRSAGASFNNSPSQAVSSERAIVDNRPATVSDGAWSNVMGGVVLNGRMTFTGAAITGIEDDDFAVLDDADMEQSGWLIDVSASFTTAGGFVDVSATPPVGTSGNFKLQLDATSVQSGGSSLNNAPANNVISAEAAIDSTGLITTWGTPVFCGTSNEVDSTISFSHDVTGFTPSDIVVRNAGDTEDVSGWTHTISGTGRTYTIESVPPPGTNSIFRLRLSANAVIFRPSETGPTSNADSPQFNVDNRTSLNPPSAEFVIPNDVQTGGTTDIAVSFGERVWILSEFDFTITGYDPEPNILILAQDHQIRIRVAQSTPPLFRLRNITGAPSILSTIRSPLGPSSGATDRWIIRLSRPFRDLNPNEVVYKTTPTGPDVSLNRNPIFVDSNYTLRITNPANASGTLNAVLRKYAVNAVDDNLRGPEVPQNSGSYAFDTVLLPEFTIGNAYASGDSTDTTTLMEPFDEATIYVEVGLDQDGTGLQATDFIVSGACAGSPLSIISPSRTWRLPVHIPEADKGSLTVGIPSNVIDQRNQPASKTFTFDRSTEAQLEQPYLVATNVPTTEQTGMQFTFTVTAYVDGAMVNLENLQPSDFIITSPEGNLSPTIT